MDLEKQKIVIFQNWLWVLVKNWNICAFWFFSKIGQSKLSFVTLQIEIYPLKPQKILIKKVESFAFFQWGQSMIFGQKLESFFLFFMIFGQKIKRFFLFLLNSPKQSVFDVLARKLSILNQKNVDFKTSKIWHFS